jgi:PAS domain S-box-containing protein
LKIRILALEDSATQLESLKHLLEESGFVVITATNGKEGLAAARANAIDLVISDIVMPEMDGYDFCKALRADETLRNLPVILLTSLTEPQDLILGLQAGADHFICKPYDEQELLAHVRSIFANQAIRNTASSEMGINIFFAGQQSFINADRLQILDLLLSTYENAVSRNNELIRSREELRSLNEQLEARVAERTKALSSEIEAHNQALVALRKSEELFRISFDNANIGKAITTLGGRLVRINAAFCAILGREQAEMAEMAFSEFIHPDDQTKNWETLRDLLSGELTSARFERRYLHKDGHVVWVDESVMLLRDVASGEPAFFITHIVDITERKRAEAQQKNLEEQLRAAQKMEAIGSLAGGIAHDFNNLLSVILSYTGFLMKAVPEGDPSRSDLLEVKQAAERAATLTRQLLAFSRKQVLQPVQLDLNQVIKGIDKMLARILGEDIELSYTLESDLGLTLADPGQIEQVLMNLVVNARDAMPEGGKLTIETSNAETDAGYTAQHLDMAPGAYVRIAVSDTGCGMDKATQAKIFEPFFTTKPMGKGTGLGLSTVYGIVKQSGGFIWVYSEPGQGTTFKIFLPRISASSAATVNKPQAKNMRFAGTETILLVEDEEAMRRATKRILEAAGYTILASSDGDDALGVSARYPGEIHLLLTDVIMPHRGGKDLAQELLKSRPSLKVIYMSGYTDDAIVNHGVLESGTNFIGKPFVEDDIIRKVQEVLSGVAADRTDGQEQAPKADAEIKDRPINKATLMALPSDLLARLRTAVIAAHFDDIVELVGTIKAIDPELASGLGQMVERYDYDALRNVLYDE